MDYSRDEMARPATEPTQEEEGEKRHTEAMQYGGWLGGVSELLLHCDTDSCGTLRCIHSLRRFLWEADGVA